MSRPLRLEFPGAFYHITSRGNARQTIFLDETDFIKFLDFLDKEKEQQLWHCYAYCLMNNHYHLLIETPEPNLIKGMRRLNGSYTQYFNKRHGRVGHLFQGRYKSIIVDKDNYLLELCRYIVLNPVRAKVVKKPDQWKWSSYRATIGKDNYPDWLKKGLILKQFNRTKGKAVEGYKRFVKDGIDANSPWVNLRGQIWLGGEDFINRIGKYIKNRESKEIPDEQRKPLRPDREEILEEVSREYKTSKKEILKRNSKETYMTAVYLLRRVCNIGIREVAEMFRISEGMVSKIQREVNEGKKKNKKLDKLIQKYKVQT